MFAHWPQNETVAMTSTLPWKMKIHISDTALWLCRAVLLPLFPSLSIVYMKVFVPCHGAISSLVEYDNIHASHLDVPGRCRHPKFEVVLYRGAGVF